jgi:hypothetical protein
MESASEVSAGASAQAIEAPSNAQQATDIANCVKSV